MPLCCRTLTLKGIPTLLCCLSLIRALPGHCSFVSTGLTLLKGGRLFTYTSVLSLALFKQITSTNPGWRAFIRPWQNMSYWISCQSWPLSLDAEWLDWNKVRQKLQTGLFIMSAHVVLACSDVWNDKLQHLLLHQSHDGFICEHGKRQWGQVSVHW